MHITKTEEFSTAVIGHILANRIALNVPDDTKVTIYGIPHSQHDNTLKGIKVNWDWNEEPNKHGQYKRSK